MWVRVRPLSSWLCWSRISPRSCSRSLQAQRLGEVIVDLDLAGGLHRLDGDREHRRLALQFRRRIIVRERHLDVALVARLGADQAVFEAGDQLSRA